MAKVKFSVAAYGDTFDKPYLLDVTQPGHWVNGMGKKGLDAIFDLADILIEGGAKARLPFTIDPYPMCYDNIEYSDAEKEDSKSRYRFLPRWDKQLVKLSLRNGSKKGRSWTCYLPEVGNTHKYAEPLHWAEIGRRCNRNSVPIEMLFSMVGKTPYYGFLTDEAGYARWLVVIKTSKLSAASLLGFAVGMKVGDSVPNIVGCVLKKNGKTQASFRCVSCGCHGNADAVTVTARNIKERGRSSLACGEVGKNARTQVNQQRSIKIKYLR